MNGNNANTPTEVLLAALASNTAIRAKAEVCSPVTLVPYTTYFIASPNDPTVSVQLFFHLQDIIKLNCFCKQSYTVWADLPCIHDGLLDKFGLFWAVVVLCDYLT